MPKASPPSSPSARPSSKGAEVSNLSRAQKSAEAMWAKDAFSKDLGLTLIDVAEGAAKVSLQIEARHCNGHGIAHGAVLFALADSASALASNARNRVAVSQHNFITYIAPARLGDHLIAHAREVSLSGRNSLCDVTVCDQNTNKLAEFRGMIRVTSTPLYDEPSNGDPK